MNYESFKVGQIVYAVGRRIMGNTKRTTTVVHTYKIVSLDPEQKSIVAAGMNGTRTYWKSAWKKWRYTKPVLVRTLIGGYRLATREELKSMKEQPDAEQGRST